MNNSLVNLLENASNARWKTKEISWKTVTEIWKGSNKKKNQKGGKKKKANIELVQQKNRVRRQRSRQNTIKKLLSSDSPAYKSTWSLGKAVKKAQSALPSSPRKRAVAVKKLSLQFITDSVDAKPKAGLTVLAEETK